MTLTLQEEQFKERRCRLICLDLDGTLLNDEKEIDPEDIREIREASEKGIEIALVTGRMPAATEPIVKKLGVHCILACDPGKSMSQRIMDLPCQTVPFPGFRIPDGFLRIQLQSVICLFQLQIGLMKPLI